jgi:thioredoxin reductase (NADPH)
VIETDALIVGAGPVGLFQAFQLGLLEIDAQIVDSLPYPGGQCIELYPDKPIYDIPGVLRYTGRELVANLLRQVAPFKPAFHLGQEVSRIERQADGRFLVETSKATRFLARVIIIAGGVGAFQPRRLKIDGIERFQDSQLFYRAEESSDFAGKDLLIVGGDETALDAVNRFAAPGQARSVTLLHRRDVLAGLPDALADFQELRDSGAAKFVVGQITGFDERDGRLVAAQITDPEGQTRPLPLDAMLVFLGISPKLGAIADWGLAMERKQLTVDTEKFATSEPGILAVGDINTYPGKKKLILSGFHEAALAAFGAAAIVFPDRKTMLQYTTTSPRLHQLLGVASAPPAGE